MGQFPCRKTYGIKLLNLEKLHYLPQYWVRYRSQGFKEEEKILRKGWNLRYLGQGGWRGGGEGGEKEGEGKKGG